MTRKLVYTSDALDNLEDIADFISDESGSEDVAESFILKLHERCRKIASLPATLGSARPELVADLRSTPHHGYVILFRYCEDRLEIINVLHASRDIAAHYHEGDAS